MEKSMAETKVQTADGLRFNTLLAVTSVVGNAGIAGGWDFSRFHVTAYDGRLYGKEFVGERVQCGAIIVSSFVSRVERSGFSQESLYLARFVNVGRYVLKHYRRLFGHTSALAFFIRPFIFPCTL